MIGHRGVTHSVVAVIGCFAVLRWQGLGRPAVDAVVVGYLSHLGADLMTTSGLRLAWPLRRRYAVPLCRTGSLRESVIVAGVALSATAAMLHLHVTLL